jgi:hypothetical protein
MSRTKLIAAAFACSSLWACSPGSAPIDDTGAQLPRTLEGAWHATRIDVALGPDQGTHTVDVQPAIYIFSKAHYAMAAVQGFEARPYQSENPTDEENGRAFVPYTASSGTYASTADKLTVTPLVSKDPAVMAAAAPINYDLSWVDDRVWLTTSTPTEGSVRTELSRLDSNILDVSPDMEKLRGIWRRAEVVVGVGEEAGGHTADVQPGYYVFSPPYFAGVFVSSFSPRPLLDDNPTDADMGKAFAPFAGFAGTYTLTDGTLVLRPLVAMKPNNMRGRPFQSIKTEWAGDDVWFVYVGSDGTQNRVRLSRVSE